MKNFSEYDAFAENFAKTRGGAWPEFDIFLPQIKKGDRILDLGCGNGRLRKFLDEKIVFPGNYFGFDISENLLSIARENFPKDHFFRGDFSKNLPFGAENFDWIISIAAFHHLLDAASQKKFLNEAFRSLKPGGKIFITTWILPKKYFWENFWRGRVFTKNWIIPFGHDQHPRTYRKVTLGDLEKCLKNSGFRVILAEKFGERNSVAFAEKPTA